MFHLAQSLVSTCCVCGLVSENQQSICHYCEQFMPRIEQSCECCALPLTTSKICGKCLKIPPSYKQIIHVWSYEHLVRKLIYKLKYGNELYLAQVFASYLIKVITEKYQNTSLPELIIPVPIHTLRYLKRHFNQTSEIATYLSKQLKITMDVNVCKRVKYTRHQARLSQLLRKKNVHDAFMIEKPLAYQHIALVDDVVTTGQTVETISKLLIEAGACRVDIWCVARTPD